MFLVLLLLLLLLLFFFDDDDDDDDFLFPDDVLVLVLVLVFVLLLAPAPPPTFRPEVFATTCFFIGFNFFLFGNARSKFFCYLQTSFFSNLSCFFNFCSCKCTSFSQ